MGWLGLALITAASFGLYNVFMKVASSRMHFVVGAFVLQLVATIAGAIVLAVTRARGGPLEVSNRGLVFAALAGLSVGAAELLTFVVLARGAPSSLAMPVILGGSLIVTAIVGATFLGERLTLAQWIGVVCVVAGVGLLSSGERGH